MGLACSTDADKPNSVGDTTSRAVRSTCEMELGPREDVRCAMQDADAILGHGSRSAFRDGGKARDYV